jgi:phytoene desaturase
MNKTYNKSVAIIGGGIGGLSAAIHLKLQGFDVKIYEANERVGGRANLIERDGFRFDVGPSLLNYPWIFEQLFASAGREMKDYITLLPVDPSIKFQWSDGVHLTLSGNLQMFLEECERIESGSRPDVFAFLQDAAEKYRIAFDKMVSRNVDSPLRWFGSLSVSEMFRTGVWRSLDGELKRYFKSRYLREALGSYSMYLGGSPYDLPGMFSILPYGELAFGLWLPKGGMYALVRGIEKLARELGVEIKTNCRVEKIRVRDGRAEELKLYDGTNIECGLIVSNADVPTTNTTLIDADAHLLQNLKRDAEKTRMTPGVITFYWGVRGAIPNLGHHTIFLPQDFRGAFDDLMKHKRIPRQLPFYVSVSSVTDSSLAPEDCNTVFVLAPTPLLSELNGTDWRAETEKVKTQVLQTLSKHNIEILQESILFEEVYTPVEWNKKFGLYDGSAFGAAHNLFQVGPFRSRNYSDKIKGLYYVGASTTPGTGLPMVVLSGKQTAERIVANVR